MARLKDLAISTKDAFLLPLDLIEEKEGYNVRNMDAPETITHIRQMADAIHAGGTVNFPPISIFTEGDQIFVRAGHCRRRAFKLAESEGAPIKGILCIVSKQKEDEATLDLLNSNDGSLPLTPLEKANAVKRLLSFEWTVPEIARRRGVSAQTIHNLLALLDAPAEAVKLVEEGKVAVTLAVETVRKEGAIFGTEKLKKAVKKAEDQGKKHATKRHMEKKEVIRIETKVTDTGHVFVGVDHVGKKVVVTVL